MNASDAFSLLLFVLLCSSGIWNKILLGQNDKLRRENRALKDTVKKFQDNALPYAQTVLEMFPRKRGKK